MILTTFFFVIFLHLLSKTENKNRIYLVLFSLIGYIFIIIAEQFYLSFAYDINFNTSDPQRYFDDIKKLSVGDFLFFITGPAKEKSNTYYYLINWWLFQQYIHPFIFGIFIKITNTLVFLCAYLLISKKWSKVTVIDFLILWHPYFIVTMIRNIRDLHIIFWLSLFIVTINKKSKKVIDYLILITLPPVMYTLRSINIGFFIFSIWLKKIIEIKGIKKYLVILFSMIIAIFTTILFIDKIFPIILSSVVSVFKYHGGNSNSIPIEEFSNYNVFFKFIIKESIKGTLMFVFSPSPISWTKNFLSARHNGWYSIYTDIDNILIILGSTITYVATLPLFLKLLVNIKKTNIYFLSIILFTILMYSTFYLGITDLRTKYLLSFFIFACFNNTSLSFKISKKKDFNLFLISIGMLIVVSIT